EESRSVHITRATVNKTETDRAEQLLLARLLMDADLFEEKRLELQELFVREDIMKIFFKLAAFYEQYDLPNYQRFVETLEDRQLQNVVMGAIRADISEEHTAQEVEDCIRHLKRNQLKRLIEQKQHESKEAEKRNDLSKAMELGSEVIQLLRSLKVL
ncbi:DNA primase, partial [Sporosarcina sp. GW1-11]|nr:DNA primase [Sporosarcina sp. GW1-11]